MTDPQIIITLATKNEGKRLELARKLEEANLPVQLVIHPDAPDVEETGQDFIENAALKARLTPSAPGSELVLAEDSGLVVEALDGRYGISPFPGLYSNRWMTPAIRDELLSPDAQAPGWSVAAGATPGLSIAGKPTDRVTEKGVTNDDLCRGVLMLMQGQANRTARYCCGMVLWHPTRGRLFETLESTGLRVIDANPRGSNGFGYDPIMSPDDPWLDANGLADWRNRTMAELSTDEKNRLSHRGRAFRKLLTALLPGLLNP